MTCLLDTHTFLWFIDGSEQLNNHAKHLIEDPSNNRYISIASLWEMAIKVSIKKLEIPLPFTHLVQKHIRGNAINILPIYPGHLDEQRKLPFYHNDPFDRLIIAQSITENMGVIIRDKQFNAYPVELIWEA